MRLHSSGEFAVFCMCVCEERNKTFSAKISVKCCLLCTRYIDCMWTQDQQFVVHNENPQQVIECFPVCLVYSVENQTKPNKKLALWNRRPVQLNVEEHPSLLLDPLIALTHPARLEHSINGLLHWHPPQRQAGSRGRREKKGSFKDYIWRHF